MRDRVITIGPGLEVNISGVTISHGWAASWSSPSSLGGEIYIEGSVLDLTDASIIRNKTTGGGGAGIANVDASGAYSNVIFRGNFTDSSGGRGGGLLNVGSDPTLTNVVFMDNEGEPGGGNMSGDDGQEIFNDDDGAIELHHSLYGDGPGDVVEGGGFEATNSLTVNPLFAARRSARLRAGSPAIDAGDPDTDLALFPVDDTGAPIDLDGNPRVIGEVIDIGAYEHQAVGAMATEASTATHGYGST